LHGCRRITEAAEAKYLTLVNLTAYIFKLAGNSEFFYAEYNRIPISGAISVCNTRRIFRVPTIMRFDFLGAGISGNDLTNDLAVTKYSYGIGYTNKLLHIVSY
jgi:hypothetical protein